MKSKVTEFSMNVSREMKEVRTSSSPLTLGNQDLAPFTVTFSAFVDSSLYLLCLHCSSSKQMQNGTVGENAHWSSSLP